MVIETPCVLDTDRQTGQAPVQIQQAIHVEPEYELEVSVMKSGRCHSIASMLLTIAGVLFAVGGFVILLVRPMSANQILLVVAAFATASIGLISLGGICGQRSRLLGELLGKNLSSDQLRVKYLAIQAQSLC